MMTDEQILTALGLTHVHTDLQQSVLANVHSIAEARLVLVLDEILTDEQRQKFDELEAETAADAGAWFLTEFPQLQKMYDAIIEDILADDKFHPQVG